MIKQIFLLASLLCFVILGFSTDPIDNAKSQCLEFLEKISNSSIPGWNRSIEENQTLFYSGHNINDLGAYDLCIKLPTQLYTLCIVDADGLGGTIGFCGPSYCTVEQLQNYSDTAVQLLSNMTGQDLSALEILFVDPNQKNIQTGFSFFVAVLIMSILFTLIVAGTISATCRRTRRERRERRKMKAEQEQMRDGLREALLINKDNTNDTIQDVAVSTYRKESSSRRSRRKAGGILIHIIECFDIVENYRELLKNEVLPNHDSNLNIFNGIRVFAFGWVVYGHTFLLSASAKNYAYASIFVQSTWLLPVIGAFYAVDAFFYLSGFLTGFIMLSKLKKMRFGLLSYIQIMFHRLIRLWPTYFVVILFYWKISVHMGSGPLWYQYVEEAQLCTNQAWKNFLLLDNILTEEFSRYCFGWGWYLSTDLQVFFLAPFICWIYIKNKERCNNVIWILITISIIASYIYSADSGFTFLLVAIKEGTKTADYMTDYYINPVVRMSPYLLGLWIGFMFKEYKEGEKNFFSWIKHSQKRSILCCLSGFCLIIFILFYPRVLQTGSTWSNGFALTWSTFARPLFGIGLFLFSTPSLVGNLKILTHFLKNYYFVIISRISYAGYLIHLIFLQLLFFNMHQFYGLSQSYQAAMAFAMFLVVCFGSVIVHLVIEKPITNLEARILSGKKKEGSSKSPKKEI